MSALITKGNNSVTVVSLMSFSPPFVQKETACDMLFAIRDGALFKMESTQGGRIYFSAGENS